MTGQWFSLDNLVSSTNKTDSHDITEILLKVALNTITITNLFKSFTIVYLMLMSNVKGTDPFTFRGGRCNLFLEPDLFFTPSKTQIRFVDVKNIHAYFFFKTYQHFLLKTSGLIINLLPLSGKMSH